MKRDDTIINDEIWVSFRQICKYLRSWISYDLHDTFDVASRISKGNQAMGALIFFGIQML